jgi:8-oxo-dGTP pyrophosphatase MutT (NUDIX family)
LWTQAAEPENPAVVRLREYYQDPEAPRAHDVLPAVFAAVRAESGEILLVRRIDDGFWELPGGRIEVGETVTQALVREVAEESGITIDPTGISGVYSDPSHVLVDPDDVIHQQLAICFHAVPAAKPHAQHPRPDGIETSAAAWFSTTDAKGLVMHPAMRLRIDDAVAALQQPTFD